MSWCHGKKPPQDTKTAWELMMTDRGGLYLDSKPGVYKDVIELDFASLFPSIIAREIYLLKH